MGRCRRPSVPESHTMLPRSFVTPLIVCILVSVATVVTFSTASSSSVPRSRVALDVGRMATPAESAPPRGLVVGDGLTEHTAAELSRALPGWTVDGVSGRGAGRLVPALRDYKSAHRSVPPVVVLALDPSGRTVRPRAYQYAVDMLPARTTVVLQSGAGDPGVRAPGRGPSAPHLRGPVAGAGTAPPGGPAARRRRVHGDRPDPPVAVAPRDPATARGRAGSAGWRAGRGSRSRSRRGGCRSRTGSSRRSGWRTATPARRGPEEVHLRRQELARRRCCPRSGPVVRSMSTGVTTSRCSTRSPKPGKCSSSTACALSPKRSRSVSQSLPRSSYGAYCTKHDMTCLPGGAMSGSTTDWIAASMKGRSEYQPYFAASKARSTYSIVGPMLRKPPKWSTVSGSAGKTGSPSRAKLTFAETPRNFIRSTLSTRSPGSAARVDQLEEGTPRVERRDHDRGAELGAVLERDADRRPVLLEHRGDRRLEPDLGAERLGGPRQHLGEAAVAALVERPRAEVAVVLAHLVEEQHQPGAGRHRPDLRADDARGGVEALDRLVLEVVVEPVRRRCR